MGPLTDDSPSSPQRPHLTQWHINDTDIPACRGHSMHLLRAHDSWRSSAPSLHVIHRSLGGCGVAS